MSVALLDGQKGKLHRSGLLGRLIWYSVAESLLVDHEETVEQLKKLGLSRALPLPPQDKNVFLRVTTDAQRKRVPHPGTTNEFENWMVRDVSSRRDDSPVLTRRLVMELVDPDDRKLGYEQVVDVEFDRDDKTISTIWQVGETSPHRSSTAQEIVEDIYLQFAVEKGMLNAWAIREWIRKEIVAMGATAVRPTGGVYFLKEEYADQVETLETFVSELPGDNDCHSVEIPDNDKQREMIRRAIEAETIGSIEQMMVAVHKVKSEGKLTPKRYLALVSEARQLEARMTDYSKMLEKDMSKIATRLGLLQSHINGLSGLQAAPVRKRK